MSCFFHSTFCTTLQLADSYGGPVVAYTAQENLRNAKKCLQHNEISTTKCIGLILLYRANFMVLWFVSLVLLLVFIVLC